MSLLLLSRRRGGVSQVGATGLLYSEDFEARPTGVLQSAWTTGDAPPGVTAPDGNFYWLQNHGGTVSTTSPLSGTKSLDFFHVGVPNDTDQNREQRLTLPVNCTLGFGMEWDQRVPSNFVLRDQVGGTTSKWFQFWRNNHSDYSASGSNFGIGASFRRSGVGNQVELMVVVTDTGCFTCNAAFVLLIDPDTPTNAPIRPGQVHNIKWRVRYSSGPSVSDGLYELLVDNAVVYQNNALALWTFANDGPPSVRSGYLMGYTNAGYAADTTWTWDNIKFYHQSTRWW
jgi:hypothetical protein